MDPAFRKSSILSAFVAFVWENTDINFKLNSDSKELENEYEDVFCFFVNTQE